MNFVLAAGGTGGHMVPAHALAAELRSRGHGVLLITDDRGARFPGLFEGLPVHILPAGRLTKSPLGMVRGIRSLMTGRREAKRLYRDHRPDAVIGFGGYPAVPALLAAIVDGHLDGSPRAECGARSRQPLPRQRRRGDRDGL